MSKFPDRSTPPCNFARFQTHCLHSWVSSPTLSLQYASNAAQFTMKFSWILTATASEISLIGLKSLKFWKFVCNHIRFKQCYIAMELSFTMATWGIETGKAELKKLSERKCVQVLEKNKITRIQFLLNHWFLQDTKSTVYYWNLIHLHVYSMQRLKCNLEI